MLSIKYKKNIYLLLIISDKELIYNNLNNKLFINIIHQMILLLMKLIE